MCCYNSTCPLLAWLNYVSEQQAWLKVAVTLCSRNGSRSCLHAQGLQDSTRGGMGGGTGPVTGMIGLTVLPLVFPDAAACSDRGGGVQLQLKDVPLRKMFLYTSLAGAVLGMTQILVITGRPYSPTLLFSTLNPATRLWSMSVLERCAPVTGKLGMGRIEGCGITSTSLV